MAAEWERSLVSENEMERNTFKKQIKCINYIYKKSKHIFIIIVMKITKKNLWDIFISVGV